MALAVVATCNLNQWAMDFEGNLQRIRCSIAKARKSQARYRLGPELEISGYGCEDHFLELDTYTHSWECIAEIIQSGDSDDIFLDIGAPVMHRDVAYNCRILILNREILLIRPKCDLANDGNYRETRWFTAWHPQRPIENFHLPAIVQNICKNEPATCPIGQAYVQLEDGFSIGCESCEEFMTPRAAHVDLFLAGVHIIGNGSGSHHVLRKLGMRVEYIQALLRKSGGAYLYSNQIGCDGGRLYYDGSAIVALNGDVLAQGSQFNLATEVELVVATVDLDDIVSYRNAVKSRSVQAARHATNGYSLHVVNPKSRFSILHSESGSDASQHVTTPLPSLRYWTPEEEIAKGPACWLWDYLRRSGLNGFFIALSGGADSSSTAALVGSMCQQLVQAVNADDVEERLLSEIRQVTQTDKEYYPSDARELAQRLLHTAYMPSEGASSAETRERAHAVAKDIGAYHTLVDITSIVQATVSAFVRAFGVAFEPRFRTRGGTSTQNLALQNVQARVRMLVAYLCAQLLLWTRGRSGALLVLGSGNVDECLRGYLTKYDCSAADINPIGGISKTDLKRFLIWGAKDHPVGLGYLSLKGVVDAPPSAELEPIEDDYVQTDEQDMGMTYDDLSWFGRLRKLQHCGPLSMFRKLCSTWKDRAMDVTEVARQVKFFFRMYAINRHKVTTLTPSYHAEDYSPEDNRFDLRQFLYNTKWSWQFRRIDEEVKQLAVKRHQ